MSDSVRREYVDTINDLGNDQLKEKFVEASQQAILEKADIPAGLTPDQKKLYLDLLQMGLDLVGIVEPTPFADGSNAVISLLRGDFIGAGLSLAGFIPYIGDLAKVGKLGKWGETVSDVVEMAAKNEAFANTVKPLLEKIDGAFDSIPPAIFNSLSASNQADLESFALKVKNLLNGSMDLGARLVRELSMSPDDQRALLRAAMESSGTGRIAHHVVPLEALQRFPELMQKAALGGFNMNGRNNGALLLREDHIGGHPEYNAAVMSAISKLDPNLSPANAAAAMQNIADKLLDAINNGTYGPWG